MNVVLHNGLVYLLHQGTTGNNSFNLPQQVDAYYGKENDMVVGYGGADFISTGYGDDIIYATGYGYGIAGGGVDGDCTINGGSGNDSIYGGTGNDTVLVSRGKDLCVGGLGRDTLDFKYIASLEDAFANPAAGVVVNLSSNSACDTNYLHAPLKDWRFMTFSTVSGFENVNGTAASDVIVGSSADNVLDGRQGKDALMGLAGNDVLIGGDDRFEQADTFDGGLGRDIIHCGKHATADLSKFEVVSRTDHAQDIVVFTSVNDSGLVAGTYDVVYDFGSGEDKIDLGKIDANPHLIGDQRFMVVGSFSASGVGEATLSYVNSGRDTLVSVDVDSDAYAEMSFLVKDVLLKATDFIL